MADFVMTFTYWMSAAESRKRFHLLKQCIQSQPGQEPLAPYLIAEERQELNCPKELVRRHTQFDGPSKKAAYTGSDRHDVGIMSHAPQPTAASPDGSRTSRQ